MIKLVAALLCVALPSMGAAIDDAARAFLSNAAVGVVPSKVGASISNAMCGGLMFFSISKFTNLNATATLSNLASTVIPSNTLTNDGDTVLAEWGVKLANALVNTNQFQVTYGSATLLDTGLQPSSNAPVRVQVAITRTGNTSQHVEATLWWGARWWSSICNYQRKYRTLRNQWPEQSSSLAWGRAKAGSAHQQ